MAVIILRPNIKPKDQQGFTLIELIVVLVIISIMSVASVQFIANMAKGYSDMTRRQGMSDVTQLVLERMGRELRNALPNSVRVSSNSAMSCLEFIPVVGASVYRDLPVSVAANRFEAVPTGVGSVGWETGEPLFVAVYPIESNASDEIHNGNPIYDMDNHAIVARLSDPAQFVSDQGATDLIDVMLSASHRFPTTAPNNRFYVVRSPVSYCLNLSSGDVFRYSNYLASGNVFVESQPITSAQGLPNAEPNRTLVAAGVSSNASFTDPAFAYVETPLQRNGLVLFDVQVEEQGESVRIQHVVQVRNAP
ncbi:MAG: PulJ/GspJ family protein [Pontibacterium sp.]